MSDLKDKSKRILIIGDSGRGKSTLAKVLSQKSNIKYYSTDDFYWKKKFSIPESKEISSQKILKIYHQDSWIVEGSTRGLIREGLVKSDLIIYLSYKNLVSQFWFLFKRNLTRKEEKFYNLFNLYKHLICKKYKIGPQKNKESLEEMTIPYQSKIIRLNSFKEINNFINKF